MIIPTNEIPSDTLRNIVESFVLREGTDYGDYDVDFESKIQQVMQQLETGEVVVEYSELHETIDLVLRADIARN